MGYYDEPQDYEITVSFTCSNPECEHENEDIETSVGHLYVEDADVDCEECGTTNYVSLGDNSCHCGDHCRC
jgi:hypothetical protein